MHVSSQPGSVTAVYLQQAVDHHHHHPRQPQQYACARCGNSYARLHSLSRHVRFECGVDPKFECPVCHKKSKHKHNLLLHMKTHLKWSSAPNDPFRPQCRIWGGWGAKGAISCRKGLQFSLLPWTASPKSGTGRTQWGRWYERRKFPGRSEWIYQLANSALNWPWPGSGGWITFHGTVRVVPPTIAARCDWCRPLRVQKCHVICKWFS